MSFEEHFTETPALRSFVREVVRNPLFVKLKDAFVSTCPMGEKNSETSTSVAHGMYLGTRHVFNEMKRIAKTSEEQKKDKKQERKGETDPDLES